MHPKELTKCTLINLFSYFYPRFKNILIRFILIFALLILSFSCKSNDICPHNNPNILVLIKNHSLMVEVADNPVSRQCGLSNRNTLDPNTGMLFIFKKAGLHPFWMKNTSIPLAIAFVDEEKNIINIEKMWTVNTLHLYRPINPVLYAIEANIDWFSEQNIKAGDKVKFK